MCGALMLKSSASTRMGLSTYASCLEVANWHRMGESAAHKHVPGHHASGVCRRECFACPDACACKQKSACPPKAEPVPARCDCGSGRTCTRRAQTPRAAPRAVHAPPRQTSACRWRGARRRGRRCWPHAHALPQPPAGVQGCAAGCGAPGGLGPAQRVDEIPGGGWVGWGGGVARRRDKPGPTRARMPAKQQGQSVCCQGRCRDAEQSRGIASKAPALEV